MRRLNLRKAAKAPITFGAALLGPQKRGPGQQRLWILTYHRVLPADDPRHALEEPGMVVSPATLANQLDIVGKLFTVTHLGDWLRRRQQGKPLPERACAITFDDGWRDNYEFALPVLRAAEVPATVFVATEMLGTRQQFWPNRLANALMKQEKQEPSLALDWLRPLVPFPLNERPDQAQLTRIIAYCKQRDDQWIEEQLARTEEILGCGHHPKDKPDLMSWEELREMTTGGLVTVGSHTCTHRRLNSSLDDKILHNEIVESSRQIAERLGQPPSLFCYPNGDADSRARQLVAQHYEGAVTTRRGINASDVNPYSLSRIGIDEQGCGTPLRLRARLSGWL